MGYYEGEIGPLTTGNNGNNNGWNDWSWIIGLAVVGGIFGNGGFGFGNNNNNRFCCGTPATQADLANGFAQNTLQRGIDDIILGQAQAINYNNQGFAGLNTAITNGVADINATVNAGFAGVNNAVCTLGFQNQAGFNSLGSQLASCCCDIRQAISDCCCTTQRNIDALRFDNCQNTSAIIRAGQDNTRAILDYLTNEKIEGLRAENTALKGQISNEHQSKYLIDVLGPKCPQPAYVVQPAQPVTFPTNCCGNVAYANYGNGSCGATVV